MMNIRSNKGNLIISTSVAVSVGLAVLGFLWTTIGKVDSKAESTKTEVSGLKTDVSVIKNDVSWIREKLEAK